MTDLFNDIFPHNDSPVDRETLMKYLDGTLPTDEMHRIEALLLESDLLSDAVEGLQGSDAGKKLPAIEKELRSDLEKLLKKRNDQRSKRIIRELPWLYIIIIIFLLLIIISFVVVKAYL